VKTMPNDGELVDFFAKVVPDEELRKRILVDNPARLYGRTRKPRRRLLVFQRHLAPSNGVPLRLPRA